MNKRHDNVVNLSEFRKAREDKERLRVGDEPSEPQLSLEEAISLAKDIVSEFSDTSKLLPEHDKYNHGPEARSLEDELTSQRSIVAQYSTSDLVRLMSEYKANPDHFHKPYLYVMAERLIDTFEKTPHTA